MQSATTFRIVILALLFLFGSFLLGQRFTGFVMMSQSCCMPSPNCENSCAVIQEPASQQSGIGAALIILTIGLLIVEVFFERTRRELKREKIKKMTEIKRVF